MAAINRTIGGHAVQIERATGRQRLRLGYQLAKESAGPLAILFTSVQLDAETVKGARNVLKDLWEGEDVQMSEVRSLVTHMINSLGSIDPDKLTLFAEEVLCMGVSIDAKELSKTDPLAEMPDWGFADLIQLLIAVLEFQLGPISPVSDTQSSMSATSTGQS